MAVNLASAVYQYEHARVMGITPESKTVKNRWHIDVWVGADNVQSVSEQLISRGATFRHEGQQGPHGWITMADPEGNEFCLS